jgi:hypothetical protein
MLEGRPKLSPRLAKAVLQATSSLISGDGVTKAGSGTLNAAAAAAAARFPRSNLVGTTIPTEILSLALIQDSIADTVLWGSVTPGATSSADPLGIADDTVLWGSRLGPTVPLDDSYSESPTYSSNSQQFSLVDYLLSGAGGN